MSEHQTGPVPDSIKSARAPLDVNERQDQREGKTGVAFTIETGQNMPTITLEKRHLGKEGSVSPVSDKELQKSVDEKPVDPYHNYRNDFIQA